MAKHTRKDVEDFFLDHIGELTPGTDNRAIYAELFKEFTDDELRTFQNRCAGGFIPPVWIPNMEEAIIDHEIVMRIGERLGAQYYQHLVLVDPITGEENTTPLPHLVLDVPVNRQSQHGSKGVSTAESNDVVDQLSGQATGVSKSATMSLPEASILKDAGHHNAILEFTKVMGGDEDAFNSMMDQIDETGGFSLQSILDADTRPQVTKLLKHYLLGIGADNNIEG